MSIYGSVVLYVAVAFATAFLTKLGEELAHKITKKRKYKKKD